ncbi:MAG: 3-dehydroquinate synthase, partial [Paracoccus sp. (in: a-proteobacteria)]
AQHLRQMGMPARLSDIPGDLPDGAALVALMGQDKKVLDGRLRFVLARDIGAAFVCDQVPGDLLRQLLRESRDG